ncbi:hypothetical protein BsWGS_08139 [Bradybaena similaris]
MTLMIYCLLTLAVVGTVVAAEQNAKLGPLRRFLKQTQSDLSADGFPSESSVNLDEPLQDQPRQRVSYDTQAEYEEEVRRRQELRRRHEEERQKLIEERRRLENERRRHQEDRQRQENERRRQEEERVRQSEQERRYQQQSLTTRGQGSRQNITSLQHPDINRRQQLPVQTPHSHQDATSYDTFNQDARISHQQGHSSQPSGINGSTYHSLRHTGYPSGSRISTPQRSVFRTNYTYDHGSPAAVNPTSQFVYQPYQHIIPSQRQPSTQQQTYIPNQRPGSGNLQNQQTGQVDSRPAVGSSRGASPNYWTRYEHAGQGNWYPAQDAGTYYYPFNEQEVYSTCPDTGVEVRINGLDCQQAVEQYGNSLCYSQEYTSRLCCEVCRPKKQVSKTGCEYGDHSQQCSTITAADCYDVRNRQICCETCDRLRKRDAAVGCEYGDMSIRCDAVRQNAGLCYRPENQRVCCETCSQSRNVSNPGCPWGNVDQNLCQMFDDHTSNVRVNCYSHQKRRLCCQTCERLKEWLPHDLPGDCQYGDKPVVFTTSHYGRLNCSTILNYFSVEECSTNPTFYVNCCYTCHRYLHGRG